MDMKKIPGTIAASRRILAGKKGFVFTMLALLLAAFFTIVFSAETSPSQDYQVSLTEARLNMLKYYEDNFYSFAEATGSISGYFAVQSELGDIRISKSYRLNFEAEFINCTQYGWINSTKNCSDMIKQNRSLVQFLDMMNAAAMKELKIQSTYKINNLAVTQLQDPFMLDVLANITLNISDPFANISTTRLLDFPIDVNGMQDPLYLVEGDYYQVINKTNITKREGTWVLSDLEDLINRSTYRRTPSGVSFLNRLKGNMTNSTMGIESYVNLTEVYVNAEGNYSLVDYLYWNKVNFQCSPAAGLEQVVYINDSSLTRLPAPPPYIKIDNSHRLMFNISNSSTISPSSISPC